MGSFDSDVSVDTGGGTVADVDGTDSADVVDSGGSGCVGDCAAAVELVATVPVVGGAVVALAAVSVVIDSGAVDGAGAEREVSLASSAPPQAVAPISRTSPKAPQRHDRSCGSFAA